MSVYPGIVRGENVKPGTVNEAILLFQQSSKENREIIIKLLRTCKNNPELYGKLAKMIKGNELEKAKEIIISTDI